MSATVQLHRGTSTLSSTPKAMPEPLAPVTSQQDITSPKTESPAPSTSSVVAFDPEKHVEKSEFTRMRQADAEKIRRSQEAYEQRERALQARENEILEAARALAARQQGLNQPQNDPYSKYRELPYVDGATLVEIIQQLRESDIGTLKGGFNVRDQALQMLYKELMQMRQQLGGFHSRNAEADFNARLQGVREKLSLPDKPWVSEFLKDIYLSHEGDDLNESFPGMAEARLKELRAAFREMDKAAAADARAKAATIPTSGGVATPTNPLKGGYKSPKQLADELFPLLEASGRDDA